MILHYILKWPYALKILVCVTCAVLAIYIIIKLTYYIIRKLAMPLFFTILKYAIYLLQLLALAIAKAKPKQREKIEKFDESLNRLGIKSVEWQKQLKIEISDKYKKVLIMGIFILFFASALFIIIPYYMEPTLSGNAKEICSKINQIPRDIEDNIQSYADQYYIPVSKEESSLGNAEETAITPPLPEYEEKYILHLNANGYTGANLRSSPEKITGNVITAVSGEVELIYENEIVYDESITWLKVSTENIPEAWISKKLIQEEDLDAAGIE